MELPSQWPGCCESWRCVLLAAFRPVGKAGLTHWLSPSHTGKFTGYLVLGLGRGDADPVRRWPNCSFFPPIRCWNFSGNLGLPPQRLTSPYVTPQLSVLPALLDHSPEGSQSPVRSTACTKVHLPVAHASQSLASEGGLEGQM